MFKPYNISVQHLKLSVLCSSIVEGSSINSPTAYALSDDVVNGALVSGCISAITSSEKSVCFVKILETHEADQPYIDGYRFPVAHGHFSFKNI